MKPIKLKLQGLHSYQDIQEIDFSKLCERGTFGIFGPTGSGKSTVLDAITLALFGKVERAPKNTRQGIINHNSDKVYVSYTFELNSGDGSNRYIVERQFKKIRENTVQSGNCRLIEEGDFGQRVLADKVNDVDQSVVQILGLTVDDFTRAVVLPQGKFAEFLSLQGRDRRMMLQRLFNLESYGDKLQEKVKKRSEVVVNSIEGIEREKQGLGDASEMTLENAKVSLEKAKEAELQSKVALEKTQKIFDQYREIWQKQTELHGVISDKKLLLKEEGEITASEKELNQAERAESIRHLLEEQEHLDRLKDIQAKELEGAQDIFYRTESEQKNLQKVFLNTEKEWEEKQPLLIMRKTRLEEAKVLEKEITALMIDATERHKNKKACTAVVAELDTQIHILRSKRETSLKEQNAMRSIVGNHTVSPEDRQQINLAYNTYREYQDILGQLSESKKEFNHKKKLYQQAENGFQEAEQFLLAVVAEEKTISENYQKEKKRSPGDEKKFFYHINEVIRYEKEINDLKEKITTLTNDLSTAQINRKKTREDYETLEKSIKALEEERNKIEGELKDQERQNLAGMLVESLENGAPCPVCGAREHPEPAQANDSIENLNILKEKSAECTKELDKLAEELRTSEKSIYQQQLYLDSLKDKLEQENILIEEKQTYLSHQRNSLPEAWQKLDSDELKLTYERQLATLEQLEKAVTEVKDRLNAAKSKRDVSLSRKQSLYENIEESEAKLTALEYRLKEKEAQLNGARGDIDILEIVNEWKKLGEWDKKIADLKTRIEKVEQEIEDTNISLQEAEKGIKEKQIEEAELAMNLNQLKISYEEKKTLLNNITAGETVEKLLVETNKELMVLKDKKEQAKVTLENVSEKRTKAEKNLTTFKADFANTLNRIEILKDKLLMGLKEQDFENETDARSSLRPIEICRGLKEKIQKFNKKLEALLEREKDLEKLLEQKTLSEEEWQTVQAQLKLCIENHEKALEDKGAAIRALKDIQAKHFRWQQLEEEFKKLQKHGNLLRELRRVLTGNAFIEFMAEEHLLNVARIASARLGELTKNRYTLEVDSEGGFIIRDDANGGFRRPVSSLSGGETFLVSFSLALALSSQIQLRGTYPLEFFFLDEGFGSLDPELLEVVISALERLQMGSLSIGVISHVQEMRNRMARRLIVTPAQVGGEGSKLTMEIG
ncbi:MAG: hypothetical protein APF76_03590 [Desulfitibacter sp. BRH_c19]|nr:MAG: hypothetical protein APF76_03590 [Desulfitibacter sp. BRH_c19]